MKYICVQVLGVTDTSRPNARTPTFAVAKEGHTSWELAESLCRKGIWCTAGNHYAGFWKAQGGGLANNDDGMARLGMLHYNTLEDVEQDYALHTTHYSLRTAHQHYAHYALHTTHYMRHIIHTAHYTLYTLHTTHYTTHYTLRITHYALRAAHGALHTAHYALHTTRHTGIARARCCLIATYTSAAPDCITILEGVKRALLALNAVYTRAYSKKGTRPPLPEHRAEALDKRSNRSCRGRVVANTCLGWLYR